MDFTLEKYKELISSLEDAGYRNVTFEQYCSNKEELSEVRFIMLRHDVDLNPENSLSIAKIEHEQGVKSSYYFRVVEQSNRPEVIRSIVDLGHEIGYHYEDMAICGGNTEKAIAHFKKQLDYFRQFYPVKTICMHGSPRSRYDGRDLWKRYDYHDYGIVGEPYFDVDFSKVFYLTDTGRRWDGFHVSLRDKIPLFQVEWIRKGWTYHCTDDLMKALSDGSFPQQLMMTTHPQRWTDRCLPWCKELVFQSAKNMVKGAMVRRS